MIELDERVAGLYGIGKQPGYFGVFTRQQSKLALFANGARVKKRWTDPAGDLHGIGAQGSVLGSISHAGIVGYFVEWDASPKFATFVVEYKLERA